MRKTLLLLTPLLLTGCIQQSGSYHISDTRDHAITVRAEQEYFWKDTITLTVVSSRYPDCQRAMPFTKVGKNDVAVELFSNGDGVYTLRSGTEVMQVDTQSCTRLADPAPDALGEGVGVFTLGKEKLEFNVAAPASPAAAAPATTAAAAPEATPAAPPADAAAPAAGEAPATTTPP
ncbi:MAG: hypothetical protein ACJ8GW_03880 [Massilia sp.]